MMSISTKDVVVARCGRQTRRTYIVSYLLKDLKHCEGMIVYKSQCLRLKEESISSASFQPLAVALPARLKIPEAIANPGLLLLLLLPPCFMQHYQIRDPVSITTNGISVFPSSRVQPPVALSLPLKSPTRFAECSTVCSV